MKEPLISLETAKLAKDKGFPQDFNKLRGDNYYNYKGELNGDVTEYLRVLIRKEDTSKFESIKAPSQSLLAKWLRDVHKIFLSVERCVIGSDEWEFGYYIDWLPKEHHEEKRRVGFFKEKKSFVDNYPHSYSGAWHTYEEALEAGLFAALNLISNEKP